MCNRIYLNEIVNFSLCKIKIIFTILKLIEKSTKSYNYSQYFLLYFFLINNSHNYLFVVFFYNFTSTRTNTDLVLN